MELQMNEQKEEHADQNPFVGTNLMDLAGPPVTMYVCIYDGVL